MGLMGKRGLAMQHGRDVGLGVGGSTAKPVTWTRCGPSPGASLRVPGRRGMSAWHGG